MKTYSKSLIYYCLYFYFIIFCFRQYWIEFVPRVSIKAGGIKAPPLAWRIMGCVLYHAAWYILYPRICYTTNKTGSVYLYLVGKSLSKYPNEVQGKITIIPLLLLSFVFDIMEVNLSDVLAIVLRIIWNA